jgi:biotin carboxyl carrier protein
MTGKLMSFDVQIGQTVAEGTQVATVEAMKMNTYVYASKAGKVLEFVAKPGDTVEEHAVLLRIG